MEDIKRLYVEGLLDALVSRGPNKGMLKAKCPPMGTYGSAVWQALMMHANPYKVGLGHMLFMDGTILEVYEYAYKEFEGKDMSRLDRDASVFKFLKLM